MSLFDDPVFQSNEVVTKMNRLKKQYNKVAGKKKPKVKKDTKADKDVDEEAEAKKDGEESKKDK